MLDKKIDIIVIVGPTASGKTKLSLSISKVLCGEIISADSMQIYKEFEILTAKPSNLELAEVRHHLINVVSAKEDFSVADFVKQAKVSIEEVVDRSKIPIIVGGTGLYVDSLINNVEFSGEKVNEKLREQLWEEVRQNGPDKLLEELKGVDKISAESIHPNNLKKLIRAVEFYRTTGVPISRQVQNSQKNDTPYNANIIGLNFRDRSNLYNRINKRVDIMFQSGLIDEVRYVYDIGVSKTASGAIGYKEVVPYLKGLCTLDWTIEKIKMETRRYAKRQLTWFRRNENIKWFYVDDYSQYNDLFLSVINYLKEEKYKKRK